ncbi:MAG: cytochrome b/b6 domain-containing protein [Paracoccaceae bacterium]|nr:MAG: cytochrome b/b6 domain-containing protein [Paracoccaceae bacterium]
MPAAAYHPASRALHWLTVLLVLSTIPVGALMVQEGWPRAVQDPMYIWHKNVGVVILLVVLARLVLRWRHPPPPLPASVPPVQARVAEAVHGLLYLLLVVMAVSGYVRVVAGGFPLESLDALGVPRIVPRSDALAGTAKAIHWWVRIPLVLLILAHVGAAAFHGIVRRDGVFSRMWPQRGE